MGDASGVSADEGVPGSAGVRVYGVVRTRIVLDEDAPNLVRVEIYNPGTGEWEELSDELAGYIADHGVPLTVGLNPGGFHGTDAIPREYIGPLGRYVIEWVREDELPRRPVMVNEGVEARLYGVVRVRRG